MDNLFDQLKAEPPVKQGDFSSANTKYPNRKLCVDDFKSRKNDASRRESLPAVIGNAQYNSEGVSGPGAPANKCRSMSPLGEKVNKNSLNQKDVTKLFVEKKVPVVKESKEEQFDLCEEGPKKQMPTKAQQKLFEPELKFIPTSDCQVKACKIRIKRENLIQLQKEFAWNRNKKLRNAKPVKSATESPKSGAKRTSDTEKGSVSPPAKKSRASKDLKQKTVVAKNAKAGTGFFIKLNSSPPTTKKEPVSKLRAKSQSPTGGSEKTSKRTSVRGVSSLSSPIWTTKATKFTRTQLIKDFGKRYFNSVVKIKRCRHPLMLTFESNALAQKQQTRNKSKNLSVSFKEQVEIIGCSDSESCYSEENVVSTKGNGQPVDETTSTHLAKVENGKVVEAIEFDASLFTDEDFGNNSSTPLRKKIEKKSYSPLKDDNSPSARSEQLKLANEKLPPCGLRRLRDTTVEDDDDDDDESECIVPVQISEMRSNSLNNTIDSAASTKGSDADAISSNDLDESKPEKEEISTTDEKATDSKTVTDGLLEKDKVEDVKSESPDPNISQLPASPKETEHVKGNEAKLDEEKIENINTVLDAYESKKLLQESDSCALTQIASNTSDLQENESENLENTTIEKLTNRIEILQTSTTEQKDFTSTIDSITDVKKTAIST